MAHRAPEYSKLRRPIGSEPHGSIDVSVTGLIKYFTVRCHPLNRSIGHYGIHRYMNCGVPPRASATTSNSAKLDNGPGAKSFEYTLFEYSPGRW